MTARPRGFAAAAGTLLCFTIVAASSPRVQTAAITEGAPVPGGIAALAAALGLDTAPDRGRFVSEITRVAYETSETNPRIDAWLRSLRAGTITAAADDRDVVPLPLPAAVWSDAVFRTRVAPAGLFEAIIADRRAALVCHGLAALDDETLAFFAAHPALVRRLYERDAPVFAVFSAGLRVRDGRIVVPGAGLAQTGGADAAVPLWEAVVGESIARPERFAAALFARDGGRAAYLYDAIAHLDTAHERFALGFWIDNDLSRLDRFGALARNSDSAFREWRIRTLPFTRPVYDVATVLDRVRVERTGAPAAPASRAFWRAAFTDGRIDSTGARDEGRVDAAWLADEVGGALRRRTDRVDQLSFGQRVFGASTAEQAATAAGVVAAFPRFQMLMLTLERIGVTDPEVYGEATHAASRANALDGKHAFAALAQFQGALAVLTRMYRAGSLDAAHRDSALAALLALPVQGGAYGAAMAAWINQLFPEADLGLEDAVIERLAGPAADPRTAAAVQWEGQRYHLDLAQAERRRLARIRKKQGKPTLDFAVALALAGDRARTAESDPAAIAAELRRLLPDVPADEPADDRDSLTATRTRAAQDTVQRAAEELVALRTRDRSRIAAALEPIRAASDAYLADALLSFAYAIDLGDPDGAALLAGNPIRRHDFGLRLADSDQRVRTAWGIPRQVVAPAVPWHIEGSALGLDIGMATLALRRIDANAIGAAPRLSANERQSFALTVALMNAYALTDHQRDAMAAAIAGGRERVARLAVEPGALEAVAAGLSLDGSRLRALRWTVAHEPERVPTMFALTELLHLGGGGAIDGVDLWGTAALPWTGCACTTMPVPGSWRRLIGRPQLGVLATAVADLNLQVAMVMRELRLPAAITRHVLAAAMQDFIDQVQPLSPDDWLSMVRAAQDVGRERVEDYVAAVAADGPLVPDP